MTAELKDLPTWHMPEHAPLDWLISLIFTEQFWDMQSITQNRFDFTKAHDFYNAIIPAPYDSYDAAWKAAADFVASDEQAKTLHDKAMAAIECGELSYHQYPTNEWGDKLAFGRDDDIDSYAFLEWVSNQGYNIPKEILVTSQYVIHRAFDRKANAEQQAYSFPAITQEDFARVRKEPLWLVSTALLYLLGRRARTTGKEHEYKGENGIYEKLLKYAKDANNTHHLTFVLPEYVLPKVGDEKSKDDHEHQYTLDSKVAPEDIIKWAKTLPLELPMLGATAAPLATTAHISPEMQLMLDALEHFWKDYDGKNAPLKKHVTAWLQEEGAKRSITLSDNLAEGMDSIMRPLNARRGGLKSAKG